MQGRRTMTTKFENLAVIVSSGALASSVAELERDMQRMLRIQFKEFIHWLEEVPEQPPRGTYLRLVDTLAWNRCA